MTAQRPDDGATPEDRGDVPFLPEDVWQRFLTDDEHAIRASAPREPSARQRASGQRPQPPRTGGSPRERYDAADAVGELWTPDDPWEGPSWRDLDGRTRLRRVGRAVGTAAAIAAALAAWSLLSTGAGTPAGGPGDTVLRQSENVPAQLPATTSLPAGPVSPSPTASVVRSG